MSTRLTYSVISGLQTDNTDINVTISKAQVLSTDNPETRVTRSYVLSLVTDAVKINFNESLILCLTKETPCITKRCQCWKIDRLDGVSFYFTTHDRPLEFFGKTYIPCGSLSATASESGIVSSSASDTSFSGMIKHDSVTEHDLSSGLFDGAKVEVWLVPWDDPEFTNDSPQRINAGVLGNISHGRSTYTAEMLTPASKLLSSSLLNTYTPACRFNLGDGRCPINIEDIKLESAVTGEVKKDSLYQSQFRQFIDLDIPVVDENISFLDSYFNLSSLVWTSGDNVGIRHEVKNYSDGVMTLWNSAPYPIKIGDTYTLIPGCDKTKGNHVLKFGLTMVSFGGFPDIPGTDVLVRTPDAK